jgi:hypothetical protein
MFVLEVIHQTDVIFKTCDSHVSLLNFERFVSILI